MPFSNRGMMKLDAKKVIQHLEKSAEYLLRLRALYEPAHPEYVAAIDQLLQPISDLRDAVAEFAKLI